MLLWSTRRAQPLAELSQAERSEAQPREARPPPKAAGAVRRPGAEGDPRASRGLQTKARMRLYWLRLSTWRLNTCRRRESVLCTNGITLRAEASERKQWELCESFYELKLLKGSSGSSASHYSTSFDLVHSL